MRLLVAVVIVVAAACSSSAPRAPTDSASADPPASTAGPAGWVALEPVVVATHPHDPGAFTQGLVFDDGRLFESTGRRGGSTLREVDLETGTVIRSIDLDDRYFGEGLALVDDRLILLTWQSQVAFVHDRDTFEQLGSFDYPTEGWGLCRDGGRLVMSDGSARLVFRDPDTFESTGTVEVTLDGQPVERLNELECVDGDVWANVWLTDSVVRIDPDTGDVTGVVDASALEPDRPDDDQAVLNGIAYDEDTRRFLLTGKLWSTVYEVELVPAEG